jgi:hypothetical protein
MTMFLHHSDFCIFGFWETRTWLEIVIGRICWFCSDSVLCLHYHTIVVLHSVFGKRKWRCWIEDVPMSPDSWGLLWSPIMCHVSLNVCYQGRRSVWCRLCFLFFFFFQSSGFCFVCMQFYISNWQLPSISYSKQREKETSSSVQANIMLVISLPLYLFIC